MSERTSKTRQSRAVPADDGFNVVYQQVVGRIKFGDGELHPVAAAMVALGDHMVANEVTNGSYTFTLGDGQFTVNVSHSTVEGPAGHPGAEVLRQVLARMAARRVSLDAAIRHFDSHGLIPPGVSVQWLHDRVMSLVQDAEDGSVE